MSMTAAQVMGLYAPDVFGRLNPVVVRNDTPEGSRRIRHVQAVERISLNFRSVLRDFGLFVGVGRGGRTVVRRSALSRASALLRGWAVWHLAQTKKAHLSVSLFAKSGAGTRSRTRDLLITRKVVKTIESMGYVIPCYVLMRWSPLKMLAQVRLLREDRSVLGVECLGPNFDGRCSLVVIALCRPPSCIGLDQHIQSLSSAQSPRTRSRKTGQDTPLLTGPPVCDARLTFSKGRTYQHSLHVIFPQEEVISDWCQTDS